MARERPCLFVNSGASLELRSFYSLSDTLSAFARLFCIDVLQRAGVWAVRFVPCGFARFITSIAFEFYSALGAQRRLVQHCRVSMGNRAAADLPIEGKTVRAMVTLLSKRGRALFQEGVLNQEDENATLRAR
jgi:hypothetical protein